MVPTMNGARTDPWRRGPASRVVIATGVGALVGVTAAVATTRVLVISRGVIEPENQLIEPWGVVVGVITCLAATGISLVVVGKRVQRRVGYAVVALAGGLLATGTWWFIDGWGVPPWTLEGAWMWPLAVVSTVVAIVALIRALRPTRR